MLGKRRIVWQAGSSPRMRGTQQRQHAGGLLHGIIPAYAGNTCRNGTRGCCTWDHPRVCGEHWLIAFASAAISGSSPRMRGTRDSVDCRDCTSGIIPAYAGNTCLLRRRPRHQRDHPRVCGEHACGDDGHARIQGSSPRMRGTRRMETSAITRTGIIPAYAGNTTGASKTAAEAGDHPRVCGEHMDFPHLQNATAGSSPRMRGTLSLARQCARTRGIIPAYAGNTKRKRVRRTINRDHPRVCGEHPRAPIIMFTSAGSSPRMRGTQGGVVVGGGAHGIIPAYAGNTPCIPVFCGMNGDHPRVCGEHMSTKRSAAFFAGSSPRMRGTRH